MSFVIYTPDAEQYNRMTQTQRFNYLIRGLREIWKPSDQKTRDAILFTLGFQFREGHYLDMLVDDDLMDVDHEARPARHLRLVR